MIIIKYEGLSSGSKGIKEGSAEDIGKIQVET